MRVANQALLEFWMKVLKFGGTSLGNWQRFEQASEIIIKAAEKKRLQQFFPRQLQLQILLLK